MSTGFDAYHKWLGIPPEEQPPNYYQLLGIKLFESDPDVIEYAADRQMAHLRTFQAGRHSAASQTLLNEVASAKVCLLNAEKKAAYDASLRQKMQVSDAAAYTSQSESSPPVPADWAAPLPGVARPWSTPKRRGMPTGAVFAAAAGILLVAILLVWLSAKPKKPAAATTAAATPAKSTTDTALPTAKTTSTTPEVAATPKSVPTPSVAVTPSPMAGAKTSVSTATAKDSGKTPDNPPVKQLTNSIGMRFVLIPAGEFWMGSKQEDLDWALGEAAKKNDSWGRTRIASETPRHKVRISRPFYMGAYEVTRAEYQQVTGKGPSISPTDDAGRHPLARLSWESASRFCQKLSARAEEQAAGRKYRLPTEAEWEYAARAGSTTMWSFGDDPAALGDHAWFDLNSGGVSHLVGQKKPNAWGLYDMYGSVWEWCQDKYDREYYRQSPLVDPPGPEVGKSRVVRGGAWDAPAYLSRSASHRYNVTNAVANSFGFRVVILP